jgi:hypothetical protein
MERWLATMVSRATNIWPRSSRPSLTNDALSPVGAVELEAFILLRRGRLAGRLLTADAVSASSLALLSSSESDSTLTLRFDCAVPVRFAGVVVGLARRVVRGFFLTSERI